MSLKCYYHQNRDAITKCDDCEKLVCMECKKTLNKVSGVGETMMSTRKDICPECHLDYHYENFGTMDRKKKLAIQGAILIILLSILIIMSPSLLDLEEPCGTFKLLPFFVLLFIVIFVSLGILSLPFWTPKKQKEIDEEREEFLKRIKHDSEVLPENSENLTYPSCGNKISANQKICNVWGIEL